MGISVRNDVNTGMASYAVGYAQSAQEAAERRARLLEQAQAAMRRQQPTRAPAQSSIKQQEDEDMARNAASLRNSSARLGAKQKAEGSVLPDSYAGFNWQKPVQIYKPTTGSEAYRYSTVFENMGADPMAQQAGATPTGPGFGVLGTRENHVLDDAGVINPNDPQDIATLGNVLNFQKGTGSMNVDADNFRSQEEKDDIKREVNMQDWVRKQREAEELRRETQQQQVDRVQQQKIEAEQRRQAIKAEADAGKLPAMNTYADMQLDMLGEFENLEPDDRRRIATIRSELKKMRRGEHGLDENGQRYFLNAVNEELGAIKPLPTPKQQKQFVDEGDETATWQRDSATGEIKNYREKPQQKPEKPELDMNRLVADARKALTKMDDKGNDILPSEDQIIEYVQKTMSIMNRLKAPQGTPPPAQQQRAPAVPPQAVPPEAQQMPVTPEGQPIVRSEQDYVQLPKGTVYMAPDGKLRVKK